MDGDQKGKPASPPSVPSPAEALAQIKTELMAIPAAEVEYPYEAAGVFAKQVLSYAAASRAQGRPEEVVARLELLAAAVEGAHHNYQFIPEPDGIEPDLAARSDRQFSDLEAEAGALVAAGKYARGELPKVPGASFRDRGTRIVALVAFFRANNIATRMKLDAIERDAHVLRQDKKAVEKPSAVATTDLRNRAYTALRQAFDRALDEWGPAKA